MAVVGGASGSCSRTEYFVMDDGPSSLTPLEEPSVEGRSSTGVEEAVWDREREELEISKANFQQTVMRQSEVEQSVSSLLSRLAKLPGEGSSPTVDDSLPPTASFSSSAPIEPLRVHTERSSPLINKEEPASSVAAKAAAAAVACKSGMRRPNRLQELVESHSPKMPLPKGPLVTRPPVIGTRPPIGAAAMAKVMPPGTPPPKHASPDRKVPSPAAVEAEIMSPTLPRKSTRETFGNEQPPSPQDCGYYSDEIFTAEAASPSASSSAPPQRPPPPALPQRPPPPPASRQRPATAAPPSNSPRSPFVSPRLGQGGAVGDSSLLPKRCAGDGVDMWRGWTIETSQDGRLFYHHAASSTSQWQMPSDLTPVLGEWVPVEHSGGDNEDGSSQTYWRNELLGVSSWKDPRNSTNLFQAALDGNLFFLQLYTEVGGFLDAVDAKGRTALHYNCTGGSTQAVFYLLQNKADADATDQGGSTPLHWACRYGHDTIVRILLEAKADPDRQNDLGDTPVHEAAALGRAAALEWLVVARANLLLRSRENRTPLEVALRSRNRETVDLLRHHEKRQHRSSRRVAERHVDEDSDDTGPTSGPHGSLQAHRSSVSTSRGPLRASSPPESGSDSETDEPDPSLALVIVRAARPLLRGVQWLANRVLGEKQAPIGANNGYTFDRQSNQWVLQRQDAAIRQHWEAQAGTAPSDDSEDSGSDEDERGGGNLTPRLTATLQALKKATQRRTSHEGDGLP